MNKDYAVVLDACVLVGAGLRDTLLRLAETPRLYVPRWSDDIIAETKKVLVNKFKKTPEQVDHLESELRKAFPEAWAANYKGIEHALRNHVKDRHVLAAAIRCGAQSIVTFNLRDFQNEELRKYDIEAIHPDEFLVNQFHLDDALVTRKLIQQAAVINRTIEEQLRTFRNSLPLFTQTLADALSISLNP